MTKQRRVKKTVKQELDMVDHAERLRALPGDDAARNMLLWLAAGIILAALGWLAFVR